MAKDKIAKAFLAITKDKFTIDTIAEMIATKHLAEGDVVRLNGYYSAGDGANHIRKISKTDDGSGVQLANGLWANIVHNGEVNVSWFGAKGDGVTDDTVAIQRALDVSMGRIKYTKGTFRIKGKLKLNKFSDLDNINLYINKQQDREACIYFNGLINSETRSLTIKELNESYAENLENGIYYIESDELFCYRGGVTSNPVYKNDFFKIQNSKILGATFRDYLTSTTLRKVNLLNIESDVQIKNINLELVLCNNGSTEYDWGIMSISNNDGLTLENIKVTIANNNVPNNPVCVLSIDRCVDVLLSNVDIPQIHVAHNSSIGTYAIGMSYVYNVIFDNVKSYAKDFLNHWGSTGCNYVKNWRIVNSILSRMDCHMGGSGIYSISNTTIGEITVGGKIDVTIRDSVFTRKIRFREDYANGYFEGSFLIDGVVVDGYNNFFIELPVKKQGDRYNAKIENITIQNVDIKSFRDFNLFSIPPKLVNLPNTIKIENLKCDKFCIFERMDTFMIDESTLTIDTNYKRSSGVYAEYGNSILTRVDVDSKLKLITNLTLRNLKNISIDERYGGVINFRVVDCSVIGIAYDRFRFGFIEFLNCDIIPKSSDVNFRNTNTTLQDGTIFYKNCIFYAGETNGVKSYSITGGSSIGFYLNYSLFPTSRPVRYDNCKISDVDINSIRAEYGYADFDNKIKKLKNGNSEGLEYMSKIEIIQSLNTPYHATKMQQEGVYEDFIRYMDEKIEYDRIQKELEEQRQLEFEQRENQEQTYEEWLAEQPMFIPMENEPQPSEKLLKFKEKYLG